MDRPPTASFPRSTLPRFCLLTAFHVLCSLTAPTLGAKRLITLEDTIASPFKYDSLNATWVSDTELNYVLHETGDIVLYDVTTNTRTVIANSSLLSRYNATSYTLSADGKWIAIPYDSETGFRHSSYTKYAVHELKSEYAYDVAGGKRVQLMAWAPVGHSLVYVLDNDLYYQQKPGPLAGDRVTSGGLAGVVYNGVADWVYEEEVLQTSKALWFSPEATKLAFATFDDAKVHEINFPRYGDPGDINSQYVKEVTIRYPKAGSPNPKVTLNVIDLRLKRRMKIVNLPAPISDVTEDHILGKVKWVDDRLLAASWTDRVQTVAVTLICDTTTAECNKVLETKETAGWVDYPEFIFKNASTFLTILPQPQGEAGNFRHLTLVSNQKQTALTSGTKVVTEILKWDQNESIVYYLATEESNPSRVQLYSVVDDGSEAAECLSCGDGGSCGLASARFSRELSHYVLGCQGPGVPTYSVYAKNGTRILELVRNANLERQLLDVLMPEVENLEVDIGNGLTARVRLLLPPNLNKLNFEKRYPLLLSVYGGPDSIRITDRFAPPNWESFLATRLEAVVAYVDARGSARRGDTYKFAVFRQLGGPEIEDFITVARNLQKKLFYIDDQKTAIWGWSYGGYATAMTLAKDTEGVFQCGISVAPVTSWIYYDSIYTERYMGLPTAEDNEAGYNASDVTRRLDNFRKKKFFLIHGNADDNVHYQQSMALARAFETHDVLFTQQSYPDEAHGLVHVRRHLYHSMEKFWAKCFQVPSVTSR